MAIQNYETTLKEWENIIRVNLKVANPSLLKSGALGILTNYLAGIKFDALQFYTKTFQEMNVGLAQDFNSLLYHASIYGAELQFARASTLSASLIIPEITLANVFELIYTVPKNTRFVDKNGIPFITTAEITIVLTRNNVSATSWSAFSGTKKLSVTSAPNPNIPNSKVFLIHTSDFQQYDRKFYATVIPETIVGDPYNFSIGIDSIENLKEVKAWLNTGDHIQTSVLDNMDTDRLEVNYPDIEQMNIKFYKFESSIRDLDLFLEIFPHSLSFETGDGEHGRLLPNGSQVIVEVQNTLGENGNVPNSEFLVSEVEVRERWDNKTTKNYTTKLNGLSASGSTGGKSIQSMEEMRDSIFNRISIRNSIITENDYELLFEYQGVRPFVDAKFIDAKAFVFLFNVIRNNDNVVASTAINYKESLLFGEGGDAFYPEIDYGGYRLVSPFYYKNHDINTVDAYLVNPQVNIALRGDVYTPDITVLADYKIDIAITYDFEKESSYLEIISGGQTDLEYYFVSDTFRVTLTDQNIDHDLPFTYKIDKLFTDDYCVLRNPLTNIKVEVRDKATGEIYAIYVSDGSYGQLLWKQTFYKYFQEESDNLPLLPGKDIMAYLDNHESNVMSTFTDLVSAPGDSEDVYLLRLPFIDKNYFNSKEPYEIFEIMNTYFIANYTQDLINYNTLVSQAFHNTIDIDDKYYDSIFRRNTMDRITSPKIPISIAIHGDLNSFLTSKYQTETDFEISLRIEIIKFLKGKEGFLIEYYETDLETHLYDVFSPIIKNVNVATPTMFQVYSSAEIYNDIKKRLTFQDMLDFIPPYFYYDYANLDLTISW